MADRLSEPAGSSWLPGSPGASAQQCGSTALRARRSGRAVYDEYRQTDVVVLVLIVDARVAAARTGVSAQLGGRSACTHSEKLDRWSDRTWICTGLLFITYLRNSSMVRTIVGLRGAA